MTEILRSNASNDFLIEVQLGRIPRHSLIHKFGRNDIVPNGSFEFVTILGQTAHALSAATTVRIKAGDAADTAAGAGAREVTVQGIDSNLNEITEAIATNGTSASTSTTASFWRIHRAWVSSAGTYGSANTASITIENNAGNKDILTIAIGEGQSQDAIWSVPIRKKAYLLSIEATVDAGKSADIILCTRGNLNDTSAPLSSKRIRIHFDGILGSQDLFPKSPGAAFPALTDVWFEARGSGAATEVSVDFELLIVEDS